MSKITFRADDDLVAQLEDFDASKSEVMREALRGYLDESSDSAECDSAPDEEQPPGSSAARVTDADSIDALVAERVDAIVADRVDALAAERLTESARSTGPQDVNVNITVEAETPTTLDDARRATTVEDEPATRDESTADDDQSADRDVRKTTRSDGADAGDEPAGTCSQCGDVLTPGHVYCPNCGEKTSHRVFCDCGDELRSDWAFCPSCGRRTPAADVLDQT